MKRWTPGASRICASRSHGMSCWMPLAKLRANGRVVTVEGRVIEPTCPSTSRAPFARRHLVGSPNAKRPQPTILSSHRGRTENEDGRRDLTLILRHVPARVEIVLRIIPGVVQISDIQGAVAATHTARPDARRRRHTGITTIVGRPAPPNR